MKKIKDEKKNRSFSSTLNGILWYPFFTRQYLQLYAYITNKSLETKYQIENNNNNVENECNNNSRTPLLAGDKIS